MREIARRIASNFYDGVALVAMDPLHGGYGVRELTAELGSVPGMSQSACGRTDTASWLAERDMLLVLDGAEQLGPDALAWLRKVLAVAPGLRILAAGRSPLAFEPSRLPRRCPPAPRRPPPRGGAAPLRGSAPAPARDLRTV
ncbi:hypothetical protein ACFVZQ_34630, partial [Streptomyces sp. NPDC059538]